MKIIQSFAILAFLVSCASITPEEMKKEVAGFKFKEKNEAGHGLVYMVRPDAVGAFIRFNVFLDDREDSSEMGFTRGGQYIYFYAKPGNHKIESKAENWATIDLNVKEGRRYFIEQKASMGFLMARNSLKRVDDLKGKYYVKKCAPGTIHKTKK